MAYRFGTLTLRKIKSAISGHLAGIRWHLKEVTLSDLRQRIRKKVWGPHLSTIPVTIAWVTNATIPEMFSDGSVLSETLSAELWTSLPYLTTIFQTKFFIMWYWTYGAPMIATYSQQFPEQNYLIADYSVASNSCSHLLTVWCKTFNSIFSRCPKTILGPGLCH